MERFGWIPRPYHIFVTRWMSMAYSFTAVPSTQQSYRLAKSLPHIWKLLLVQSCLCQPDKHWWGAFWDSFSTCVLKVILNTLPSISTYSDVNMSIQPLEMCAITRQKIPETSAQRRHAKLLRAGGVSFNITYHTSTQSWLKPWNVSGM